MFVSIKGINNIPQTSKPVVLVCHFHSRSEMLFQTTLSDSKIENFCSSFS
jgi:hypothetical protein